MHTGNNVETDRWQMPSVCVKVEIENISGLQKKKTLCMNSIEDAGLNVNLNDKQTLYASNTVLIPGICTQRVIVVDYWRYGYFLPAAGIELANPDVYTSRHSDIRDSVLCSGLHNLRYCIFLSHLYLLIAWVTQLEMFPLSLLLCFVASCTCIHVHADILDIV